MITHAGVALGKDSVYLPDHPITTNDLKTPDKLQTTDGETYELNESSKGGRGASNSKVLEVNCQNL